MQPVGLAAMLSQGKGTQLRNIMKMMGQNSHPATIFWEIIHYSRKKQNKTHKQLEVISWVDISLYHKDDIWQQNILFLGLQSADWNAEVIFSDQGIHHSLYRWTLQHLKQGVTCIKATMTRNSVEYGFQEYLTIQQGIINHISYLNYTKCIHSQN